MSDPTAPGGGRWYTQRAGTRYGPFEWAELADMAASGRIAPDDLIWREGEAASHRADELPGLLHRRRGSPPWWLAALAVVAVLAGVLVVAVSGGDDGPDVAIDDVAGVDDTTAGTSATGPADGVGVVQIVAPSSDAVLLTPERAWAGDQILVTLEEDRGRADADAVAAAVGGEVVGQVELAGLWQLRVPPTDAAGIEAAVVVAAAVDGVAEAFPNEGARLDEEIWGVRVSPLSDPVYGEGRGEGYELIGVQRAWDYLAGSGVELHPVHVGVTDDGLYRGADPELSEFPNRPEGSVRIRYPNVAAGELAAPVPSSPAGSHGTGVMTVLAGDPDNGGPTGVAGVLRDRLTVSMSNVFTPPYGDPFSTTDPDPEDDAAIAWESGLTYTCGEFAAIAEQVRDGARVINMSWGNSSASPATARAFRRFFEQMAQRHPDVLFVGSAGNDGTALDGTRRYPSGLDLPNMITVGCLDNDGATTSYSNRSSASFEVTLAAPGHQAVRGVRPDGTVVATDGGTSNAAPQVTAAAALILAVDPDLTAAQVKQILTETARTTVPDGNGQRTIDAAVGGRVLAVDEAVRKVIADQLGRPVSEITPELLDSLGSLDAVAVSGADDEWTVTGYVRACRAGCTDVTITVSGDHALGGSPTRHLDAAGEVTWSVTIPELPATVLVRRTDNGAGSRITIDPIDLNGSWTGTAVIGAFDAPEEVLNQLQDLGAGTETPFGTIEEGCDLTDIIGTELGLALDITADPGGTGQVSVTLSPPEGVEGEANTIVAPLTWDGSSLTFRLENGDWSGTAERRSDGTPVLRGTWSNADVESGVSVSGTWTAGQR